MRFNLESGDAQPGGPGRRRRGVFESGTFHRRRQVLEGLQQLPLHLDSGRTYDRGFTGEFTVFFKHFSRCLGKQNL